MKAPDNNGRALIAFIMLIDIATFKAKFNFFEIPPK